MNASSAGPIDGAIVAILAGGDSTVVTANAARQACPDIALARAGRRPARNAAPRSRLDCARRRWTSGLRGCGYCRRSACRGSETAARPASVDAWTASRFRRAGMPGRQCNVVPLPFSRLCPLPQGAAARFGGAPSHGGGGSLRARPSTHAGDRHGGRLRLRRHRKAVGAGLGPGRGDPVCLELRHGSPLAPAAAAAPCRRCGERAGAGRKALAAPPRPGASKLAFQLGLETAGRQYTAVLEAGGRQPAARACRHPWRVG